MSDDISIEPISDCEAVEGEVWIFNTLINGKIYNAMVIEIMNLTNSPPTYCFKVTLKKGAIQYERLFLQSEKPFCIFDLDKGDLNLPDTTLNKNGFYIKLNRPICENMTDEELIEELADLKLKIEELKEAKLDKSLYSAVKLKQSIESEIESRAKN